MGALTLDLQGPLHTNTRPDHGPGPRLSILRLPGPLETAVLDFFEYLEHLMYPGCVACQLCHLRKGRPWLSPCPLQVGWGQGRGGRCGGYLLVGRHDPLNGVCSSREEVSGNGEGFCALAHQLLLLHL